MFYVLFSAYVYGYGFLCWYVVSFFFSMFGILVFVLHHFIGLRVAAFGIFDFCKYEPFRAGTARPTCEKYLPSECCYQARNLN